MTNVLHIISDTNIGGAGSVLLNYLAHYDRDNFSMSVVIPTDSMLKERIEALGVDIIEVNCMHDVSYERVAIKILKDVIRKANPDIVHTHGALSGRIAAKKCRKPVIFTRHTAFGPDPRFTAGLGKFIFKTINNRYSTRIIAVSPVCKNDLVMCGVPESKIDVVLNASPPVALQSEQTRQKTRRLLDIKPNQFAIGIIARLEPYKGHKYLLEAAHYLLGEGRDIKIVIAGTGSEEEKIKKQITDLNLETDVVMTGFVEDIAPLLSALDCTVNASYLEATSISLLESMSIGLPAVASNTGGNPWVIKDGQNGLIFESEDSDDLARCLMRLIDSPELRQKLKTGALEIYNREFTCENFAKNIEAVYKKTPEVKRNA